MPKVIIFLSFTLRAVCALAMLSLVACQPSAPGKTVSGTQVLAVESFLADMAQNVAGDRLKVETLVPVGADPHVYEPSPQDAARLENSSVLIVNGAGYEAWLEKTLQNLGGKRLVIIASQGLKSRSAREGEVSNNPGMDPHFWLDPTLALQYVENIRDGLVQADPSGADLYRKNAEAYIRQLKELDSWIQAQVQHIPVQRRLLVTNHESLGYFADRYGLKVTGTLIPSISSEASPSAQQLAHLVDSIRRSGAPAIFLEVGTNPQLARQVAAETSVAVVTDLYTESITPLDGPAPTYLEMLRHDTSTIVKALQ
ncbi:MAG: zinc ABC transporter substrate-binding protein [Anaerolineaceae bacterium]|nr:zinc ABC transporter substrate-binding protein [Anaerolineaceae bacterium]